MTLLEKLAAYELMKEAITGMRVVRALGKRLAGLRRAGILPPAEHRAFWQGFVEEFTRSSGLPKSMIRTALSQQIPPGTPAHKMFSNLVSLLATLYRRP